MNFRRRRVAVSRARWVRIGTAVIAALPVLLMTPASARATPPGWVNTGPLGAPIYQLALSAGHPSTLYAVGGSVIWRSDDGGASWVATRPGFLYPVNSVEGLGVSAQNPRVAYAGTSQAVKKTSNGGQHWGKIMNGLPSYPDIEAVVVDPTTDRVVYVGGDLAVYKTTDGGADWFPAHQGLTGYASLLAIDPVAPSVLYAYTGSGARMYKSIDGGAHWFGAGSGLPYDEVEALAVDPNHDQNVFAAIGGEVYRSTDGGGHWARLSAVSAADLRSLAVSTADPNTLYAGESDLYNPRPRGVFKSVDGGVTWQAVTHGFKGSTIAVDPSTPGRVYVGTGNFQNDDLGVFETTDGGAHWVPRVQGMLGTSTRSLVVAPADQQTAYAATNGDPGVYRTNDGGRSWTFAGKGLPLATRVLAMSSTDPNVVYAGLDAVEPYPPPGGVYKTVDGGRTWQPANQGIADRSVLSLVADPSNEDVVYASVFDYCGPECENGSLWKTIDGGATWFEAEPDEYIPLAISTSDPETLYGVSSSAVDRSEDGGLTWVFAGELPTSYTADALAVDPTDPTVLYAAGWNGIAKSTDAGASWIILPGGPTQANDVAVSAHDQPCAGSLSGVTCSTDGGSTWTPVGGVNGDITRVAIGAGGLMYGGSFRRGVAVHQG